MSRFGDAPVGQQTQGRSSRFGDAPIASRQAATRPMRQPQPSAVPQDDAGTDDRLAGIGQNLLQGILFNFGDEGLAQFAAIMDTATGNRPDVGYGDKVSYYLRKARTIDRKNWEERPTETFLTQLVGGAASGGAGLTRAATGTISRFAPTTGAALRAGTAGLAPRAVQGSLASAYGGGLAGAGAGEDAASRAGGAAGGAILGGTLGAALPVASTGLGATGRYLRSTFAPGTVNAPRRASEILGEAIARSGMRPNAVAPSQAVGQMQQRGIGNAAIADLSDEMTALTGAVARSPGEGRQIVGDFLRGRQEGNPALGQAGGGLWADLVDDISAKVSPSVSAKRAAEAVIATRAKQAEPLYKKARDFGAVTSAELVEIAQTPGVRAMLQRGVNMAKQRRELPNNFELDVTQPLPVGVWHQAKWAIDDAIGGAMRSGEKYKAGSYQAVQNRLLTALDEVTDGAYGVARNNFAGNSALLNALEAGKDLMKPSVSAEDIADQLAKFSSRSEQEFFRAGAAQALRDTVMSTGRKGNAAAPFLNRPDLQMKMRALFNDQAQYEDFVGRMIGRDRLYRTYAELHGSPTAGRLKTEGDLESAIMQGAEAQSIIQAATTSGRSGLIRAALGWLQDSSVRGLSEKVRTELARKLTSTNQREVAETARQIEEAARRAMRNQLRATRRRVGITQGLVLQPTATALGPREIEGQ